jgi:hypothetical protein
MLTWRYLSSMKIPGWYKEVGNEFTCTGHCYAYMCEQRHMSGPRILSQVRPNKLFPQNKSRPEMALKERKTHQNKYFLAHIQTPVKHFDLVSQYPGDVTWTTCISF